MPTRIHMIRRGSALYPASELDEDELLKRVPDGRTVAVWLVRARSLPQMRLYWAVLQAVIDNLPHLTPGHVWPFRTKEELHGALKREVGFVRPVHRLDGSVEYEPRSISEAACDQICFQDYFEAAMDKIRETFFPGNADIKAVLDIAKRRVSLLRAQAELAVKHGERRVVLDIEIVGNRKYRVIGVARHTKCGRLDLRGIVGETFDSFRAITAQVLERMEAME